MRTTLLLIFLALASVSAPAPAQAQAQTQAQTQAAGSTKVIAAWVKQLQLDGYDDIEVSRTWLGRVRIQAERGELEREVILHPGTGEVLRDYSRHEDGSYRLPLGFEVELEDDDDDDDDDDDEREDD